MSSAPARGREWSPRLWHGADFFAWLRVVAANRCAVDPSHLYIAAIATPVSAIHTLLRAVERGLYGGAIDAVRPVAPIFVIGHWRTGTTLLHELLCLDPRHTYPDTAACFAPCSPLLTGRFLREYLGFLMPGKRPMDNMPAGWDRPQEDEFALCLLGQPSTYTDIAFPNRPGFNDGALDLSGLSPRQRADWRRTFRRFVQTIGLRDRRRLVLKSPPHTARIPDILATFPDARFVHITRDPFVLFPSTANLWTSLARRHGLQKLRRPDLIREKVFREFRVIYERYLATRHLIPPGRLVEVRYEDFVGDIVGGMDRVYAGLDLGGYESVRPLIEGYVAAQAGYETNKYPLTEAERVVVRERWGDLVVQLGYRAD
jgi:omega-hydroxy-beta-dihydromenaquinone-9 sulfotransferase